MGRADSPLTGRMIFLVGARRSGTNWLQRVVAAHPNIAAVPTETFLFSRGLSPLSERIQHGAVGSVTPGSIFLDREVFLDEVRHFCDVVFESLLSRLDPTARYLVERTPEHAHSLDLMAAVYPDAYFVHILRDGRDVARSLASQDWGPASVTEAAQEWRDAVEAVRSAAPRVPQLLEVRYEELLADPRAGAANIFEFIGAGTSEDALESVLREAGVKFNVDPKAPVVASGKWREQFGAAELSAFLAVAGQTLAVVDYDATEQPRDAAAGASATSPMPESSPRRGEVPQWRKATGALRRRLTARREPEGVTSATVVKRAQETVERFLHLLGGRQFGELAALLEDDALVRVVSSTSDQQARGPDATHLLVGHFEQDSAYAGSQLRGDVHPGIPVASVVLSYRTPEGTADRVIQIGVAGPRVSRVVVYAFPLG